MQCAGCEAELLMEVATAVAIGLAQNKSIEDISVLAAFLEVVGDQLSLYATVRAGCQESARTGVPPRRNLS